MKGNVSLPSSVVEEECQAIYKDVEEKVKLIKDGKKEQTFKDDDTPLFHIIEDNDLLFHGRYPDNIHGIIAFIGKDIATTEIEQELSCLAAKFPNTPIGYLSYGPYPSDKLPPYVNMKDKRPKDYIDHLIFRYYVRSREWQNLSKTNHRYFLCNAFVVLLLLLAIPVGLIIRNYNEDQAKTVLSALQDQDDESNFTRLVNSLFVRPKPIDVKIWERNDSANVIVNTHRFSQQGDTSRYKSESSLIGQVMNAQVFLLYDSSKDCPYTVWTCDGIEQEGLYDADSGALFLSIDDKPYAFRWVPNLPGHVTEDDKLIRIMFAGNRNKAVEVVYGPGDVPEIRQTAKHSDSFLLSIQQFFMAVTMKDIKLDSKNERVIE